VTSPVRGLLATLLPALSEAEFAPVIHDALRQRVLRAVLEAAHGARSQAVVFDTHRLWTAHLPLLAELYPGSRVICCVRDVGWILDSVERMLALNPTRTSGIFKFQRLDSVYQRAEMMMSPGGGFVGVPLTTLREAWFSRFAGALVVVPYSQLTQQPERTLRALYEALGEPWFEHDLEALSFDAPERDEVLGMPGLHHVRARLQADDRAPGIPPDLLQRYAPAQFWQQPQQNPNGVTVL
jgi:sulfotransferase